MASSGADTPWTDPDEGDRRVPDVGDEYDMPADVDAAFRTVRRVAVGHFVVFLGVVVAVPILTLTVDWWSEGRLIGGMTPSFVMAAVGLYVFFFLIAAGAATLSNAVEDRMLGSPEQEPPDRDGAEP
ncbi:hypothetical protein B0I33_102550 [Prauserella shujinwangii]|uniref:Uncharacterized protein n=1 Tax=Prauserella shujinwangii TaxID=1453103 RepID=A0A2T0M1F2_9PSEU|nr:hypothetical protein [Prauserella shujinwangii]PRX50429.1 hypothetical protein B0I33_102550 [Prauserella shujinwangii]